MEKVSSKSRVPHGRGKCKKREGSRYINKTDCPYSVEYKYQLFGRIRIRIVQAYKVTRFKVSNSKQRFEIKSKQLITCNSCIPLLSITELNKF